MCYRDSRIVIGLRRSLLIRLAYKLGMPMFPLRLVDGRMLTSKCLPVTCDGRGLTTLRRLRASDTGTQAKRKLPKISQYPRVFCVCQEGPARFSEATVRCYRHSRASGIAVCHARTRMARPRTTWRRPRTDSVATPPTWRLRLRWSEPSSSACAVDDLRYHHDRTNMASTQTRFHSHCHLGRESFAAPNRQVQLDCRPSRLEPTVAGGAPGRDLASLYGVSPMTQSQCKGRRRPRRTRQLSLRPRQPVRPRPTRRPADQRLPGRRPARRVGPPRPEATAAGRAGRRHQPPRHGRQARRKHCGR